MPILLHLRTFLLILVLYLLKLLEAVNVDGDFLFLEFICLLVSDGNADAFGVDEVAVLINLLIVATRRAL